MLIKQEIKSEELYNKLSKSHSADKKLTYGIMHDDIIRATNKHIPCKLVKFNKYKHKKSTWITQGLLKSIRYRDKLYKQMRVSNRSSPHYNTILVWPTSWTPAVVWWFNCVRVSE